jgi:hypothetical protein
MSALTPRPILAPASIASAALRCFLLIALAMFLILVILPATLGAAGVQVVVAP